MNYDGLRENVDKRNDNDEYGMVLISDIAKLVLAKDRSPDRVNVYEIMAKPLIYATALAILKTSGCRVRRSSKISR
jgi:hypothetical protein